MANSYLYPKDSWNWIPNTSTTNTLTITGTNLYALPAAGPAVPKRTALEWLDDETEQVCALARKVAA